ncbi:MAG: AMP-binding protein, partial [Paracoccus sp. (in: a-proteobacteria)]|nr:AMP-binding protein [Paracoccus sp. (in: a-proteobacteria)]
SQADPEKFWTEASEAIDWTQPPSRAFFDQGPAGEWFSDGMVNTCWNAIDRHVQAGHGDRLAVIHDSAMTGKVERLTYAQLQDQVARLAGVLAAHGIGKGDRVIIYMPMIPQALQAMMACARIGAIHSVVFGGFAAHELAVRIDDARPKAILAASCGLEPNRIVPYKPLMDRALDEAVHKPDLCLVFQRPECQADMTAGRDLDWVQAVADTAPVDCIPVEGNHPAYILYTSGTTGQPKGVVRHTAGHLVALAWSVPHIYDIGPGDVFFVASDVGWVVGHSYIVYGPLIAGATTVIFEGKPVGTPDAGTFWRIIADHHVKSFFTAPTAIRAVKRDDPDGKLIGKYDLSSLKALFLAGERADPDTITWAEDHLHIPVIDHWWQTETGWPIAANPLGAGLLPVRKGSPSVPMPGYEVHVLDEAGHQVSPGTLGAIALKLPLPPGTLPTLWNAHDRFQKAYLDHFPGYYETGDAGYVDEDGYVFIMARTDDVINVAGHRLSTGAMEEVLASHPAVAECAVIGIVDTLKGQAPLGLLCLKKGVTTASEQITAEVVRMVRDRIGPVAAFKTA